MTFKLLLYTHSWAPSVGGVESITRLLAEGLIDWSRTHAADQINVTLVTQTRAGSIEDSQFGFRVVRRPGFWSLIRLVYSTDVVHLAGAALFPLVIALLLRKPVLIEHHGFQAVCPNGQLFFEPEQRFCPGHFMAKRYRKCLQCNRASKGLLGSLRMLLLTPVRRWLSNCARLNITPTTWLAEVLALQRTKTIHHGIPLIQDSASGSSSTSTFAFQGRLVTTKGAQVLLEAVRQLQEEGFELSVKVIGDGPARKGLLVQAAQSAADVRFLGHIESASLVQALADVSTVVMPSLAGEVFGLVAAENMLRGKALIVSDIGSLREVMGDCGLVFAAGDATDLAFCMRRILEEPQLAAQLGAAGKARAVRAFSMQNMIDSHASLYREVLS